MNIYNGHVFSLLFEPLCYYAKKVAIKIFKIINLMKGINFHHSIGKLHIHRYKLLFDHISNNFIVQKINGSDDSEDAKGAFNLIMLFLATFSTGYNVIVYVIFNPNFRKAILYIICFRKFRKNKVWVDSEYRSKNKMPVSSAGQTTDNH